MFFLVLNKLVTEYSIIKDKGNIFFFKDRHIVKGVDYSDNFRIKSTTPGWEAGVLDHSATKRY